MLQMFRRQNLRNKVGIGLDFGDEFVMISNHLGMHEHKCLYRRILRAKGKAVSIASQELSVTTEQNFAGLIKRSAAPLVPEHQALARLLDAGRVITVPKGGAVLKAGDVAEMLFFVQTGLLRYYYIDAETGDDRTGQFFDEGAVVTDAASFLTGAPATQTVEAVEVSTIFNIPRDALMRAYDEDHAIERFGRKMVEGGFLGSQRRAANLLNMSPDERYRHFVENRPSIPR